MAKKKKKKVYIPTADTQASALDEIRIGIAAPSMGYRAAPACALIVEGGPAKKERTCRLVEYDSFEDIQNEHPDGNWGACLSFQHGYTTQWQNEFRELIEAGVKTGVIPGSIKKIAVLFSAWHSMEKEYVVLRRKENIVVVLDHNGAFASTEEEFKLGNDILRAIRKEEQKKIERREMMEHAPKIDWDELDRNGKLYDTGGGWFSTYRSKYLR